MGGFDDLCVSFGNMTLADTQTWVDPTPYQTKEAMDHYWNAIEGFAPAQQPGSQSSTTDSPGKTEETDPDTSPKVAEPPPLQKRIKWSELGGAVVGDRRSDIEMVQHMRREGMGASKIMSIMGTIKRVQDEEDKQALEAIPEEKRAAEEEDEDKWSSISSTVVRDCKDIERQQKMGEKPCGQVARGRGGRRESFPRQCHQYQYKARR